MPGIELIQTLFRQATAHGSRTTAMNPLGWVLAIILSTLSISIWEHASSWIVVTLAAFAAFVLVVYLGAYIFFMVKNPDALRSERFTLSKMQIEKSQIGDTSYGFNQLDVPSKSTTLPAPLDVKD